jgi:two-component system chemotaxis response regulator CheY
MSDRPPKVLVVEDSPAMRQLLSITLRRCGAEVTEAGDGLAALKLLAQAQYDLMFVDLNMPVMDGLKLIQRVRSDGAASGTRICVVTTEGAEESEKQARNLGADDYLRKPVSRKAVEAALEAWRAQIK